MFPKLFPKQIKKPLKMSAVKDFIIISLPDKDSNLDCQSQNLTYYHYTIGQYNEGANVLTDCLSAKCLLQNFV